MEIISSGQKEIFITRTPFTTGQLRSFLLAGLFFCALGLWILLGTSVPYQALGFWARVHGISLDQNSVSGRLLTHLQFNDLKFESHYQKIEIKRFQIFYSLFPRPLIESLLVDGLNVHLKKKPNEILTSSLDRLALESKGGKPSLASERWPVQLDSFVGTNLTFDIFLQRQPLVVSKLEFSKPNVSDSGWSFSKFSVVGPEIRSEFKDSRLTLYWNFEAAEPTQIKIDFQIDKNPPLVTWEKL